MVASWLVPLVGIGIVIRFKPSLAQVMLVLLTAAAVSLAVWGIFDGPLRDMEDRNGPFTLVPLLVVAIAAAGLGYYRPTPAAMMLLACALTRGPAHADNSNSLPGFRSHFAAGFWEPASPEARTRVGLSRLDRRQICKGAEMTIDPFDLTGRNAVVTGGAVGIGFGIAESFVEAGANVLIADLDEDAARTAAEKLIQGPGKAAWMAADVSADGAGRAMVDECVRQLGSLDIFVNNAGIYPMVPALDMTPEMFDQVYRVNLRGLVFCSKAAASRMIEQGGGGRIVNIGSIDSFHPSAVGLAAYDSSKGAVLMFTKNLALELAPHGILVNMIAPGGIETPGATRPLQASAMAEEQMEAMRKMFTQQIPLGRFGTPREIGNAAVFFASRASDYVTGTALVVDGGRLLK